MIYTSRTYSSDSEINSQMSILVHSWNFWKFDMLYQFCIFVCMSTLSRLRLTMFTLHSRDIVAHTDIAFYSDLNVDDRSTVMFNVVHILRLFMPHIRILCIRSRRHVNLCSTSPSGGILGWRFTAGSKCWLWAVASRTTGAQESIFSIFWQFSVIRILWRL